MEKLLLVLWLLLYLSADDENWFHKVLNFHTNTSFFFLNSVKRTAFKTLVDEVQELEAKSQDPGAVVLGKR